MSWLSRLPRQVRPPKSVRTQLEKIKGTDFLPAGVKKGIDIFKTIRGAVGTARDKITNASESVEKAEKNTETIKMVAIGIALLVVFMFIRKR